MHWVYVLECEEGAWYVGITNNLQRRFQQHHTHNRGSVYTSIYKPIRVKWAKQVPTKERALELEEWITRRLQQKALKVGGGSLTNPWFNGRGRKWLQEDLDLVKWARNEIGRSLHVVNRTWCRKVQRTAVLSCPLVSTMIYSVKEWRMKHGMPKTKKGQVWAKKKPKRKVRK